ncbi:MAG: hypothetical protein M0030_26720 [Actinomycetota bacterium]|nr:hypothetical protein [Actinomycetota bacterium]
MNTTMSIPSTAAGAPAPAGSTDAGIVGPREAGAATAIDVITALADAGMSPARIGAVVEDVLGCRHDQPTAVSEEFYDAFASTAATLIADLRDLETG